MNSPINPAVNPFYARRQKRVATHSEVRDRPVSAKSTLAQPQDASSGSPRPPRFALGEIVFSGNVTLRLRTEEVLTALGRHAAGDWGDLLPEDAIANDLALRQGRRLFSAYGFGYDRFWIITDFELGVTAVQLPDD